MGGIQQILHGSLTVAYYQGKKMDHLYQEAKSKSSILGDIKNRLYQQEQGARGLSAAVS